MATSSGNKEQSTWRKEYGTKTLEQLEQDVWPEPSFDSYLVSEVHRIRKVRLQELRPEDLRLAIGQDIGLKHLAPIAVEYLEQDPWVEGGYFAGDLLLAVSRAAIRGGIPSLKSRLSRIIDDALQRVPADSTSEDAVDELKAALVKLGEGSAEEG